MPKVCKFCTLIGCQFAQKNHTKCAKLVDENIYQLFCCLTNSEFFFSIERYVYPKKSKLSMSPYYFLFCIQYEFMYLLIKNQLWEKRYAVKTKGEVLCD